MQHYFEQQRHNVANSYVFLSSFLSFCIGYWPKHCITASVWWCMWCMCYTPWTQNWHSLCLAVFYWHDDINIAVELWVGQNGQSVWLTGSWPTCAVSMEMSPERSGSNSATLQLHSAEPSLLKSLLSTRAVSDFSSSFLCTFWICVVLHFDFVAVKL